MCLREKIAYIASKMLEHRRMALRVIKIFLKKLEPEGPQEVVYPFSPDKCLSKI